MATADLWLHEYLSGKTKFEAFSQRFSKNIESSKKNSKVTHAVISTTQRARLRRDESDVTTVTTTTSTTTTVEANVVLSQRETSSIDTFDKPIFIVRSKVDVDVAQELEDFGR